MGAVAALAAVASSGCRAQPKYAVEHVAVAESPAAQRLEAVGVTRDHLGDVARQRLASAPGFTAPPAARGARRLVARLAVDGADAFMTGPDTGAVAQVAVTLELTSADGEPTRRESARTAEPLAGGPAALRVALERAATSAVERAVKGLALQLAAEREDTGELIRDLDAADAAVRDHAVRALADRGAREAVPALIARLGDGDPAVVERAVGALAQLRDPRAAGPLIELARHRDPAYVAQLARILGDIGGPDARAWLVTMSAGHPDEVVRAAARDALADLSARERDAHADAAPR